MKIAVLNGTEKHGVTYRLKELFLAEFSGAEVREFYLPRDCPAFCAGCAGCILRGEETCKDAGYVGVIQDALLEADLIVLTSPAYVFHATGGMKALLDHLAYRWMPHRPAPQMFGKRGVILTQCLGAGGGSAARDMKHSLSWWGVSKIGVYHGALMHDIYWERLPEKKQAQLTRKVRKLARRFAALDYGKPARVNLKTRVKFLFCRNIQRSIQRSGTPSRDSAYWAEQGWLDRARPWKP